MTEPAASEPDRKYPRWRWFVIFGVMLGGILGVGGYAMGFWGQATGTVTSSPIFTMEPALMVTVRATPSSTLTAVPSSTSSATPTSSVTPTKTSTLTLTPTETSTPTETPTATKTPSRTRIPIPSLLSPIFGEYQSPILFQWNGVNGISYQVTLRHIERDIVYTSDWIRGVQWSFDIPADEFGNWEWFVTVNGGARSETAVFTFNPFPGDHTNNSTNNSPDTPSGGNPTNTPAPVVPTNTPKPTIYP
jgi:hypothetical protein